MTGVKFVLGGEADIASAAEMRAEIQGGTDRILGRLNGLSKDRGVRLRPPSSVSVNPAATGTFVLDLGQPAPGTIWWLVEVIVTAADDRAAPAGAVAALYCGVPARQVSTTTIIDVPSLGTLVRPAVALPAVFAFGGEAWPVKDGEHLFIIVYSLTTAVSVLSAVATVMQLDSSAVSLDCLR